MRAIKRSHGVVQILTEDRETTMKALDELKKKIAIRQVDAREETKIKVLLPSDEIVSNGVGVLLLR